MTIELNNVSGDYITDRNVQLSHSADALEHLKAEAQQPKELLVMLLTGNDDNGKRATLAFSAACSAIAMESKTKVFLAGDGSHWAYVENIKSVEISGFPPLNELIELFLSLGGEIEICSTCYANGVCLVEPSHSGNISLKPGIQRAGFPTVVSAAHQGAALTF